MSHIQIISMFLTFRSVLCPGALCLAFLQIMKKINYDYFIINKQYPPIGMEKYVLIFARGYYLFQEANYELRRTDTVQGQNIQAYFCTK